jgi:hypothetical protein
VGIWRALLIVYHKLDVRLPRGRWLKRHFHHVATDEQIVDATESFRAFPQLVASLTSTAARVEPNIIRADWPLRSLTKNGKACYWPSPDDTRHELDEFAPMGSYDSIFVFWPQNDSTAGTSITCRGWGLGMGASVWSNGATYAVVANAPSSAWLREAPGEVWLHEWLHGVCHHFASKGHPMPTGEADGAELHGYVRSPVKGWTEYYRELMTGNVLENGQRLGIPLTAWREEPGSAV